MRAALAAALVLALIPAAAQAAPRLTKVGDFDEPVHVAGPPGDPSRLFVVEKAGRVQVLVGGVRAAAPFLDLDASVDDTGERGLLSIAFAPDYATSGLFYVFYTANDGDAHRARGAAQRRSAARHARPHAVHDPAPGHQPQRRPARVRPRRPALRQHRRRRARRPERAGPRQPARQDPAARSPARRPRPRSGRSACATRGASRSTARRAAMVIGDVGEGTNEEIDVAPSTRRQLRLEHVRGHEPDAVPARRRDRAGAEPAAHGRLLRRDRRVRGPRPRSADAPRPLPVR